MPVGECTITLQDVELILGLKVDGEAVTGLAKCNCRDLCNRLLEKVSDDFNGGKGKVSLSWLFQTFKKCPQNSTFEEVQQYARVEIFRACGYFLFPERTEKEVHLMYL